MICSARLKKHFQEGSAELQIPPYLHGTPGQAGQARINWLDNVWFFPHKWRC